MIRGYILAMAFVWVRVMYDRQNEMFPFIRNIDVRDTTREWLSFVVPVIVAETWLGWWPALRRARRLPGVRHLPRPRLRRVGRRGNNAVGGFDAQTVGCCHVQSTR